MQYISVDTYDKHIISAGSNDVDREWGKALSIYGKHLKCRSVPEIEIPDRILTVPQSCSSIVNINVWLTLSYGESFIRLIVSHIAVPSSLCNTARSCSMLSCVISLKDMSTVQRTYTVKSTLALYEFLPGGVTKFVHFIVVAIS